MKSSNDVILFRNFKCFDERFSKLDSHQSMLVKNGLIEMIGPDSEITKRVNRARSGLSNLTTRTTQSSRTTRSSRSSHQGSKAHQTPLKKIKEINLKGRLVLPAFIECHTHSLFAGGRADEFELRNQGVSYLEIAERGGGILSTMRKTRNATAAQLADILRANVRRYFKSGVATLEVKSGYGLNHETELKMLSVIKRVSKTLPIDLVSTYLGPHALPPEFRDHRDYLEEIVKTTLPELKRKKLTRRVDIFIESKFFSAADARSYLAAAQAMGFDLTIHANQLSQSGGAELALELGARSADHVIHLSDATIKKFGQVHKSQSSQTAGLNSLIRSKSVARPPKSNNPATVPVLLPLADLYMKCPYPPARKLIDAGAEVALATDFNPGSCPSQDVMLTGLLARLEMKMTLSEVFRAYTFGAAKALGLESEQGLLKPGYRAQFLVTEADICDFFYSAGFVPTHDLYKNGKIVKVDEY